MAFPAIHPHTPGPGAESVQTIPAKRVSRLQLVELKKSLKKKDLQILAEIRKFHFLTSGQIKQLHFTTGSTDAANLRATNKAMKKLREWNLVAPLTRRIGGVRAGSSALVWHLTEPGERLLWLDEPEQKHPRKRFEEPSPDYLRQTLGIAEIAVRLTALERERESLSISRLDPDYQQTLKHNGNNITLRPCLFAIFHSDEYEHHWFIEIDTGRDAIKRLVLRAENYCAAYQTGMIQKESGIFPLTLWVLPEERRKEELVKALEDSIPQFMKLFRFVTSKSLEAAICGEME